MRPLVVQPVTVAVHIVGRVWMGPSWVARCGQGTHLPFLHSMQAKAAKFVFTPKLTKATEPL